MAGQYDFGDLSGVLGSTTLAGLFGDQGFTGDPSSNAWVGDNPWMTESGINESGNIMWNGGPSEDAMQSIDDFSFNWNPTGGQGGRLDVFNADGQQQRSFNQEDESNLTKLISTVAPAIASWGFGGALSGMFGGGALGGALGHGLASGSMSSMQGGDFGKGFLSGAVGGGLKGLGQSGTTIAGLSGVTNPTLAGMLNRGAGSALGSLASGGSGSDALKSGFTGAALSGINSVGKTGMNFLNDTMKSWLSPETSVAGNDAGFDSLMGSGGDMSGQTDVSPNRYNEMITGMDGMQTYNPDYGFGGDQSPNMFSAGLSPQKSIQSTGQSDFSLPSIFGDAGRSLGNFALNNAGDLASMLYGFYNNRKQQKALGQQVTSLQGLYGQNSPYAQQLRNTLNARAAQTGRRSNVAGRETQFQAQLADRAAQMAPTLMQLNQARGQLKNRNMDIALMGLKNTGAMGALTGGLRSLFGPSTTEIPYNFGNVSGSDQFGWKGVGGM